jgi:hypothetical protein
MGKRFRELFVDRSDVTAGFFDSIADTVDALSARLAQAEQLAADMSNLVKIERAGREVSEVRLREYEEAQHDLIERVAEALYERAMGERRVFSAKPGQFNRRWRDEPYVPPVAGGESRPVDWRDGWRGEAHFVVAASGASAGTTFPLTCS